MGTFEDDGRLVLAGGQHQRNRRADVGEIEASDDAGASESDPARIGLLGSFIPEQAADHHCAHVAIRLVRDVHQFAGPRRFDQQVLNLVVFEHAAES
ncbi:hypothetical protein [Saccharopolyspora kobensis]|uniref:hypothetical protein n=1 Tax=Saccharopolyspora kobensis TaxID=146035 RepID=UPI001160FF52|nr:hypothetical protein [Saccharopolyspora kobensis]